MGAPSPEIEHRQPTRRSSRLMLTGVFLCGFDILLPLNYSVRIGNLESEHFQVWVGSLAWIWRMCYADIMHVVLSRGCCHISRKPDSGNTDHRGYFFLRSNSAVSCALVIESPHAKHDTRTGVFASEVFREMGPRAFLLTGTYRCANTTASTCSGTSSSYSGESQPYRNSDMAHVVDSFFQVFHEVAGEETASTRVIQVHSFTSGSTDPEFTVSDGTTTLWMMYRYANIRNLTGKMSSLL